MSDVGAVFFPADGAVWYHWMQDAVFAAKLPQRVKEVSVTLTKPEGASTKQDYIDALESQLKNQLPSLTAFCNFEAPEYMRQAAPVAPTNGIASRMLNLNDRQLSASDSDDSEWGDDE